MIRGHFSPQSATLAGFTRRVWFVAASNKDRTVVRFWRWSIVCLSVGFGLAGSSSNSGAVEPPQGTAATPSTKENLALGKPATASSFQDDSRWPGAAVDGEPDSRWCAADGSTPQWLRVDLGRPETLTGCRIAWEANEGSYQFRVEGSPDGKEWSTLHDATKPAAGPAPSRIRFDAKSVRHVRLTVTGLSEGQWASLFEFEVYGTQPAPAITAKKVTTDSQNVLKDIKVPPGFEATVFAAPPDVHYPTCLAATPDGEVFVGIDENGSLDAKTERGRVVRCVDTDGDGKADQFNVFATMDSPRGLIWDAGTLYVLHPPTLSAFRDTNGDGTADRSEVLVSGIGFDLKHRGADHTTNGIRLGIDGFIYVAVGDYGFVKAQGKDGDPLQMLGGGVVRVRTDGTGLAIVSRGQRNIYDVAIDPKMNLFTRDNTNDGDGWDVRLSYVVPSGNYGYPSLFKRFTNETLLPLADYGGGSPCGSIFLQEPGFPAGFGDTLYTCEWGRGAVFMHPMTPKGATFEAKQETFITIPRPTDMDVDGSGRIFISSWRDGGFNYSKPNVGYVIRVVPKDVKTKPFPDLAHADPTALVQDLAADSSVLRLAAQRELLRRGVDDATARQLEAAIETKTNAINGRIAALFTLTQGRGAKADDFLIRVMKLDADLREFAITAASDRRDSEVESPAATAMIGLLLDDPKPRIRLAALIAIGRLKSGSWGPKVAAATTDDDPIVAHAAVKTLVALHASQPCLQIIAQGDKDKASGAVRALQEMHDPEILSPLRAIAVNDQKPNAQKAALQVLCRLYFTEAPYVEGQWWGTRPDTSGPYYKPITWAGSEAIIAALRDVLKQADPALQRWLLDEMIRNKLDFEDTTALALRSAGDDPMLRAALVDLMVARSHLSHDAIAFLKQTATLARVDNPVQIRAIRGLLKHQNQTDARDAAIQLLAILGAEATPSGDLVGLWTEYARDNRRLRDLASFTKLAEGPDDPQGTLGYAVLLAASANGKAPEAARTEADAALDHAWNRTEWTPRLLRAIGLARAKGLDSRVKLLLDSNQTEIRQAAEFAATRLNIAAKPDAKGGKSIGGTPYETVLAAALADKGDVALGTQLFERVGCVNCHSVIKSAPIKGPYLGDVAARYNRSELVESILKPSARIAQGFETQRIALINGQIVDGFVVREAGTEIELRNASGNVVVVPKADIDERAKGELSVMPQGLLDPLTPHDLASLLSYLESIKGQ